MPNKYDPIPNGLYSTNSNWNRQTQEAFNIAQSINLIQTMIPVQVISVETGPEGDLTSVIFVDVLPLIHQLDGSGNSMPYSAIHKVPFVRIQGGHNAIIIDPQVGDIGLCHFSSKDISTLKKSKSGGPPATPRRFDLSDGVYLGGILNKTPNQYVRINSNSITIKASNTIILEAPSIELRSANTVIDGLLDVNGIDFSTHLHTGVTTGGGTSGGPIGI
jgi:hypothetical protein